ncbi:MAG: chorismate--pyruvate lyase [Alcanivorax borkumensis]|jgi:chorismate--pyruvate lyase|uniref:Probable chorismate pyruvate-lyase n=1 Tax=Alcanivorax borkumensis (strain ATCC 700651 / DSM 11573 / NCIMB 13689 / SK2) TaxID=393595 RepID=UBIC_ALCBS|nr:MULTISPECIES: chorismate lyase [Alcanivorax]Q0VTA8.1 RecName: Full=Probable chorismate pyruvate-lyase; Short=CL; Short=CPL [Alcanivorax borkumensis SK2]OJH07138.1 MAG: chorismate--pyruvate lyase [Alcanivorax borkumensis]EUC68986.1 chorismate--pyruvate lyase [Alcanivorax sp. 97CO-5]PKG01095.1 chorismate--pyruvate lyase [Alcanivorax sp. 97CO-6]CAL15612.1 chorismate lyase, putative [Alcanivorax borkumensis SK2]BAP13020.1 chorismate lyase [Alcanivorax sp. NBRC 101098]
MLPAALHPDSLWRPLEQLVLPPIIRDWMADPDSLTRRLKRYGHFSVVPGLHAIALPRADERRLLSLPVRRAALIREVTLHLDDTPVVAARSVLPLTSLAGANRSLGHMGSRSLGLELYNRPICQRDQVWARLASTDQHHSLCWGRQSRFIKRGAPLLVAEYFLPALWEKLHVARCVQASWLHDKAYLYASIRGEPTDAVRLSRF